MKDGLGSLGEASGEVACSWLLWALLTFNFSLPWHLVLPWRLWLLTGLVDGSGLVDRKKKAVALPPHYSDTAAWQVHLPLRWMAFLFCPTPLLWCLCTVELFWGAEGSPWMSSCSRLQCQPLGDRCHLHNWHRGGV